MKSFILLALLFIAPSSRAELLLAGKEEAKCVIVRLCSIECNFREPLDHPSNAAFADDLRCWSKLCQRLYVWDYTTDFAHYVQPHPNWFTLDANLRFFHANGVRGVFEQGAYQSPGSEMAELRAWVLAQLLWNPQQDDRALVHEFIQGYYGPEAAPHLRLYLDLMHEASKGHNLTCYSGTDAPHLRCKPLAEGEKLWQQAEVAAATNPEFLRPGSAVHLNFFELHGDGVVHSAPPLSHSAGKCSGGISDSRCSSR